MYTKAAELSIQHARHMQNEIDNFFNWTLKWKLVINAEKCSSITFTMKRNLRARVYNINNTNMECVHHPINAPTICQHNPLCQQTHSLTEFPTDDNGPYQIAHTLHSLTLPSPWAMRASDNHTIPLMVRI